MKTYIVLLASTILVTGTAAHAASTAVDINAIDANGVGKKIGTLRLSDSKQGLRIMPQLANLPPGDHGFHVHVNPDCGPGNGPNGQPAAGMAAGGHYDPANTGKHLGPYSEGHKGDLPVRHCIAIIAPRIGSLSELRTIWCGASVRVWPVTPCCIAARLRSQRGHSGNLWAAAYCRG